jgi:outer membrane protein assembly factor BamB
MRTLCVLTLLAAVSVSAAQAPKSAVNSSDWPQWRGPNRDGISSEENLLEKWPEAGPNLLWKKVELTDVGTGYGSPAVVAGKLYIMGADGPKQGAKEFITCLNVSDGAKIWQTKLTTSPGKFLDGWGGGPRCTPTVDGKNLYVLGATGDLTCVKIEKGEIVWTKNLVKDFGGGIPTWGYSESVLIDGDNLVVTPGGKGGMISLNKTTGATVWQCKEFEDAAGYSSIVIAEIDGVKQYVQQTMVGGVGVQTKDGKLLWKAGSLARRTAVIPSPIVADGHVFFTAGYGAGCECFKLEKDGSGTKATEVYTKNKTVANHHGGVVQIGKYVYGHSDNGGWVCFDFKAGGEAIWTNNGVGKGSVTAARGYLYCLSEQTGKLARVKATEKGYEESGSFTLPALSKLRPNSGKVWPHPVIADGKLFLRDFDLLYVYDIAKK